METDNEISKYPKVKCTRTKVSNKTIIECIGRNYFILMMNKCRKTAKESKVMNLKRK